MENYESPGYTPAPRKRHTVRTVVLIVVGAVALLCGVMTVVAVATGGGSTRTAATVHATASSVAATHPTTPAAPKLTVSQQQALGAARDYLTVSHFSQSGLIKQLEFDQFSVADATYAADAVGADWNAQADGAAADYMKVTHFSRASLVSQLKFDGFTDAQAQHGAASAGL